MFLGWISQMTALLDKLEAKALYSIIENIANEYPQVSFLKSIKYLYLLIILFFSL